MLARLLGVAIAALIAAVSGAGGAAVAGPKAVRAADETNRPSSSIILIAFVDCRDQAAPAPSETVEMKANPDAGHLTVVNGQSRRTTQALRLQRTMASLPPG